MKKNLLNFSKFICLLAVCFSLKANGANKQALNMPVPVANFSLTSYTVCASLSIWPTDLSTNTPTAWLWSFPGASGPTTSTLSNPMVYYNNPGVYTITLVSSNSSGTSTPIAKTVTIIPYPTGPIVISPSNTICAGGSFTATAPTAITYTWSNGANTQSSIYAPTTNTVIWGQWANGACMSSGSVALYVNPSPSLAASASPTAICAGSNVTLTAGGATSYTWSNNTFVSTTTVNPSSTTIYTVSGSNGTCTLVKTVTVNVTGVPVINIASSASVLCAGNPATLSATGAPNYTWSTAATTSVIVVSPSVTTVYTVQGTNSCFSSVQSFTLNVSSCTGLQTNNSNANEFVVYPNPSNGVFAIKSNGDATFKIIDNLGKVIKEVSLDSSNNRTLFVSDLASGIYFVVGTTEGQAIKQKIIVSK